MEGHFFCKSIHWLYTVPPYYRSIQFNFSSAVHLATLWVVCLVTGYNIWHVRKINACGTLQPSVWHFSALVVYYSCLSTSRQFGSSGWTHRSDLACTNVISTWFCQMLECFSRSETYLAWIWAVWVFTNMPCLRHCTRMYIECKREKLNVMRKITEIP